LAPSQIEIIPDCFGQFKLNLYIGLQIGEKVPLPPPLEDFSAAIYGKKGGGMGVGNTTSTMPPSAALKPTI